MRVIFDNHVHLSPLGKNIEEVKRFERLGGTHLMLVTLPREKNQTPEQQYRSTIDIAKRAMDATKVKIYTVIGPHPVEFVHLVSGGKMTIDDAKREIIRSIDIAAGLIRDGEAVALGEVGRPHFPVSADIMDASNELLSYAFRVAKEIGCAVQLHTESATPDVCRSLAELADSAGFPRGRVVKHYCPPIVDEKDNHGLFPSVLAGKDSIEKALAQGTRFVMETDFLDDLRRPGAVLDITTVPKRTKWLLETGKASDETLARIHRENPDRLYGISME
jgi:TatD-related deoxyribonuclease